MEISARKEYCLPSSDGVHMLRCVAWNPLGKPKAVVVLVHGMIEHIDRYDAFAGYLRRQGYAVVGYDQLGHGKTAQSEEELGYFADRKGHEVVIKDIHRMVTAAKKQYPQVPVVLFGHSMGSFFSRKFYTVYGQEVDGAVFCGTGSMPVPVLGAALLLAKGIKLVRGAHYRSPLLHSLVFAQNNKSIQNPETDRDWLTKDRAKIQENIDDPLCNFKFTAGAYADFFHIMFDLSRKKGYNQMPKSTPVLLIAGGLDPVGHQGEDVAVLYDTYRELGMDHVSLILCEEDRHEILNETDREAVYEQIEDWLDQWI